MINFRLLFTIKILNAYDYIDDTLATKDEQQIQAHKVIPSSKRSFSNINSIYKKELCYECGKCDYLSSHVSNLIKQYINGNDIV